MRTLVNFALLVMGALTAMALAAPASASGLQPIKKDVTQAITQGYSLNADLTLRGNVTVQAVLIPAKIARRIFGGEVANNYAVIALTITNKSSDAALIIQGAYIDYSDWALSGSVRPDKVCTKASGEDTSSAYRACTQPNQVASEEYRIVRGELLDAQNWTWRNTTVRLLTLLGSAASGYSFSVKELGYIKGISAFNGIVVPGFATFWPDGTVSQLNRISDFGFQTNKVISKQGSDIIVCFFPIDRFLTESYRTLFVKNPSVFFSPLQALVDEKVLKQVLERVPPGMLPEDRTAAMQTLKDDVPCFLYRLESEQKVQTTPEKAKPPSGAAAAAPNTGQISSNGTQTWVSEAADRYCAGKPSDHNTVLLNFISAMSLNRVHIVIDGVMSVETATLPAKVESINFEDGTDWTDIDAAKKGTITGAYLTGGVPEFENPDAVVITDVTAVADGSDDQNLHFSLRISKPLANRTKLTFWVEKKSKDGSPVASPRFESEVQYSAAVAVKIDSIKFDDSTNWTDSASPKTGTITGSHLSGGVPEIQNADAVGMSDVTAVTQGSDDQNLHFSLKITRPVTDPRNVMFVVEKKAKDGSVVDSASSGCTVGPKAQGAPASTAEQTTKTPKKPGQPAKTPKDSKNKPSAVKRHSPS